MNPITLLSPSGFKTFLNCQRLFGWQYMERLATPERRAVLEIGKAVHAALARYHATEDLEASLEAGKTSILKAVAGPTTVFAGASAGEAITEATRLVRSYVQFWGSRRDLWVPINQEVAFVVEVQPGWWAHVFRGGPAPRPTNIFLRGRLDNLSTVNRALWIVDYKTAGKMDPRDLLKYSMDSQLSAYIYGTSKQLTTPEKPIRVEGAIVDLLVKTKVPQFAREPFIRSDDEMEEFEAEFLEYSQRIADQQVRVAQGEPWKAVFPRNTEHCFRYGTCPFRDLCLQDTPIRRQAYVKRPDTGEAEILATLERRASASEAQKDQ